jgi:hypothetical protein
MDAMKFSIRAAYWLLFAVTLTKSSSAPGHSEEAHPSANCNGVDQLYANYNDVAQHYANYNLVAQIYAKYTKK